LKKITKLILSMIMLMLLFIVNPVKADAATFGSEDGLEVSIETDKDDYSTEDEINVSISVKNTNTYDMKGISIESLLPEGIKVKSGLADKADITILAGEKADIKFVAELEKTNVISNESESQQNTEEQTTVDNSVNTSGSSTSVANNSVKTGDNSRVFIWISLVLVSVIGFSVAYAIKNKKFKKFLSMFLCMTLVTGCVALTNQQEALANEKTSVVVDKNIKVDGNDYNIGAKVMSEKVTKYIVSFESNGGSEVESQAIVSGKATLPNEPQKDGYTFDGWYTDNVTFENKFDFDTIIDKDYTLYAAWTPVYGEFDNEPISGSASEVATYSITGLEINKDDNTATAVISAPENCAVLVRFIDEEVYFSDNYPENKEYINDGNTYASHVVAAGTYTEEVTAAINNEIPEYFVAEAVLLDAEGNILCNPYSDINNTKRYEEFENKTVYDFEDDDVVLNYDSQLNDNFGVLANDVKILTADEIVYDEENEVYTIKNSSEAIEADDKIFISDNNGDYIFKVKTADIQDNTVIVTVTKADDEETGFELADFYKYIKVDKTYDGEVDEDGEVRKIEDEAPLYLSTPSEESEQDEAPLSGKVIKSIHENQQAEVSMALNPISFETERFKATGKVTGKISGNVNIQYDIVLFGKDYLKFDYTYSMDAGAEAEVVAKILDSDKSDKDKKEEKENVEKELELGEIKIPIGVTGLDVAVKMDALVSWELTAGVKFTGSIKTEQGFKYNTKDGAQKVESSESSWTLDARGEIEVKFGPEPKLKLEFLGGVLNAGLECFLGVKGEATAVILNPDLEYSSDSIHACNLCVDGKVSAVVSVNVTMGYKVTDRLKGTPIDWQIGSGEVPLFKFHFSAINPEDSAYHGKMRFAIGECQNKLYRTDIFAKDTSNQDISTEVKVYNKETGRFKKKLTSGEYTYLAPGQYIVKATIDGNPCEKEFTVYDAAKNVTITTNSDIAKVSGRVVDASDRNPIAGATIIVYEGTGEVATTTTDEDGKYSFSLDGGTYKFRITAPNYISVEQNITVEEGEDQEIELLLMAGEDGDNIMGGIYGSITDAVTGNKLSDVSVKISKGWSNGVDTTEYVKEEKTDSYGEYNCRKTTLFGVDFGLDAGNYTITISKEGYIPTTFNVVIVGGKDLEFNSTITPVGEEEVYRIVLTWGEYPWDLDSHLKGTYGDEQDHIYYRRRDGMGANLDVDDITSYGPETITIPDITAYTGIITYAVHDFTNKNETESDWLSKSGAIVKVYKGANLLKTFYAPAGVQGTVWNVFYFDESHNIVPVNTFEYESDPDIVG